MSPRVFLVCVSLILGCSQAKPAADSLAARQAMPDERPVMVNRDLPFHYPGALYARRVQGNVTLRLYIDANGLTVPDSTRVVEPSGQAAFDSAAIAGARDLRFVPAKLHGEPIGMTILFPVYFRHPEAQPLPGDSALKKRGNG
jgi:TonB family protein